MDNNEYEDKIKKLNSQREQSFISQKTKGKKNAISRIEAILDKNSFNELGALSQHRSTLFNLNKKRPYTDGVIVGYGSVDKRDICIYSEDITIYGGSLGKTHGERILKIMQLAFNNKCPIIGIIEGGGARVQEGVTSLALYGDIFKQNVLSSGIIPQISIIVGPSAGGHVYSPALTDFIIMVEDQSYMFITGPKIIKTVTGVDVNFNELGGSKIHSQLSGTAHYIAQNEDDAFNYAKDLLYYLPKNTYEYNYAYLNKQAYSEKKYDFDIPTNFSKPYDVKELINSIIDQYTFLETQRDFALNIVTGFAQISGIKIGIVANQPLHLAGSIDINASIKAARFIRTCDIFNIPIVTFVDVPGFLPGVEQEHNGIIRNGAKMLYAYAEASVPLISCILRKAYGGAYIVMGSKHLGADIVYAMANSEISVMGAKESVNLLYHKEFINGENNDKKENYINAYKKEYSNPYMALDYGYIDDIIYPKDIRKSLFQSLNILKDKNITRAQKKHGNNPL